MNTRSSSKIPNITDIPDEILIEIILHLNARERVSLGNSCKRFHTLVFEDKQLLRNLDFAEDGHLTSVSDIRAYFNNDNGNPHILGVNLKNVDCIKPEVILFNYVMKAINLVDINLHGIEIRDIWVFRDFLRTLPHVERLSVDWPKWEGSFVDPKLPYCKVLQERFGSLTYLSVRLQKMSTFNHLYPALQLCQQLKELRIMAMDPGFWPSRTTLGLELKNLEILAYYGPYIREVAEYFVSNLSEPEQWTHFQLSNPSSFEDGFYLEKNVEVSEEMFESKSIKRLSYNYPKFASKLGGFVVSVCLLEEIMKINQAQLQDKFCCFSQANIEDEGQMLLPSVFQGSKLWMLRTKEAKRLLKDPKYQISYLSISHNIEQKCDAHIVASAFPSLTELVLSNVIKSKQETSKKITHFDRRAKKSNSAIPDDLEVQRNQDSSFSKLVEDTPNVKKIMVIADTRLEDDEIWDVAALNSIADWKNLSTLCLYNIPLIDGKFLVEIGKQCKHLENLQLRDLGPDHACCYMTELLRMLFHCTNLRELTLQQNNIGQLSEVFFLLANNPQLRRVYVESNSNKKFTIDLRPSVEQLLHRCSNLTKFKCLIHGMSQAESDTLLSTLERLKSDLHRPTFQFQVGFNCIAGNTVRLDSSAPSCLRF